MQPTLTQQRQIAKSSLLDDTLASYPDAWSLESDLNYLRSLLREAKGTLHYDSPLLKNLTELAQALENVSFENATLTGVSTSTTPSPDDDSTRIATTEWVRDVLVVAGGDSRYVHSQDAVASIWTIVHPLGKIPSVVIQDSAGTTVEANVVYDENDVSRLEIHFSAPVSGKAYLN